MRADELEVRCPTCGKPVMRSARHPAPFFPFCSERCRLLDLGKWLDEEHRIEEPDEREGKPSPDAPAGR